MYFLTYLNVFIYMINNMVLQIFILQSKLEKKTTRQKSMSNRLRLGQFVTQRQGATFVENWNDGWAFTDLLK
jgi:tousled-like kinase